jgi:hypothetical protein
VTVCANTSGYRPLLSTMPKRQLWCSGQSLLFQHEYHCVCQGGAGNAPYRHVVKEYDGCKMQTLYPKGPRPTGLPSPSDPQPMNTRFGTKPYIQLSPCSSPVGETCPKGVEKVPSLAHKVHPHHIAPADPSCSYTNGK